jgi:hypothetical protein
MTTNASTMPRMEPAPTFFGGDRSGVDCGVDCGIATEACEGIWWRCGVAAFSAPSGNVAGVVDGFVGARTKLIHALFETLPGSAVPNDRSTTPPSSSRDCPNPAHQFARVLRASSHLLDRRVSYQFRRLPTASRGRSAAISGKPTSTSFMIFANDSPA